MSALTDAAMNAAFFPVKQRNAFLDHMFYDTSSLTPKELGELAPWIDREGSIIVVPPVSSGRPIRHYRKALRFMTKEGASIQAIAVAGVGSSVIGTAAFARNIADALKCDVAGIVTGYGMADLLTEALGGWFAFGALDRAKLLIERLAERGLATMSEAKSNRGDVESFNYSPTLPGSADVSTLSNILLAMPPNLKFLIGHSKGSLLIDFALEQFVSDLEGDHSPLFERLRIVTFGAVVHAPSQFRHVHQFLGRLDWFGGLNSRPTVPYTPVDGAWHHLNRTKAYHLDVVSVMTKLSQEAA
jgi:hypothetical protein